MHILMCSLERMNWEFYQWMQWILTTFNSLENRCLNALKRDFCTLIFFSRNIDISFSDITFMHILMCSLERMNWEFYQWMQWILTTFNYLENRCLNGLKRDFCTLILFLKRPYRARRVSPPPPSDTLPPLGRFDPSPRTPDIIDHLPIDT